MNELELKYGCNPNQKPSRIFMRDGGDLPLQVLNGKPGYINFMDALNSWQLVRELKEATGLPAAASFKHVSPAGAAVGVPLSDVDRQIVARYLKLEVSDGIIAPGYTDEALEILKTKKKGNYNVVQIDADYVCAEQEYKDVFGITFEQGHNFFTIDENLLANVVTENKEIPDAAKIDLIVALITLKYTQSNSVCYVKDGQAIGVGAGQQSRIHCTRLAGSKADTWYLRQHPKVLGLPFLPGIGRPSRDNAIDVYISDECDDVLRDGAWQQIFTEQPEALSPEEKKAWIATQSGVSIGSDAFFPFGDNVERARKSGVAYIAEPDHHSFKVLRCLALFVKYYGLIRRALFDHDAGCQVRTFKGKDISVSILTGAALQSRNIIVLLCAEHQPDGIHRRSHLFEGCKELFSIGDIGGRAVTDSVQYDLPGSFADPDPL